MDELEAVEEKERLAGEAASAMAASATNFVLVEEPLPNFGDAAFWEGLGVINRTL
jgi:hypothetical protein